MSTDNKSRLVDPDKVSNILRDCARKHILPYYKKLAPDQIQTKSRKDDFVTIADRETEEALKPALMALLPGSILIGEEAISEDRASADILENKDQIIWVADPVDGTTNFTKGIDVFAEMLSLVVNGEVVMGWIYDVMNDRMLFAEKGKGAFIDGKKVNVAGPRSLEDARGYAKSKYFKEPMKRPLDEFLQQASGRATLNCAGHEYIGIATGEKDFSLYWDMKPWDHLAGTLAVIEAGGCVTKWDGSKYDPGDKAGGLVVTSSKNLNAALRAGVIRNMTQAPLFQP